MDIYSDPIADVLGIRNIYEIFPDWEDLEPDDAIFSRAWFGSRDMSGENNSFYGRTHSPESKEKMRLAKLGKKRDPHSDETKRKMSESAIGKPGTNIGKTFTRTDEHKNNISEAMAKIPNVRCPHCDKYGKSFAMKRYHFNNCKMRP